MLTCYNCHKKLHKDNSTYWVLKLHSSPYSINFLGTIALCSRECLHEISQPLINTR